MKKFTVVFFNGKRSAQICLFFLLLVFQFTFIFAQDLSNRVLVVYNPNISESVQVANHYQLQRNIPQSNLCAVTPTSEEGISWSEFNSSIKNPVQNCINNIDPSHQTISYIVFSYRMPFKLTDGIPSQYNYYGYPGRAIDSFLIDLWNGYSVRVNPYYVQADTKNNIYTNFQPLVSFNSSKGLFPVYSVWRLDGPSFSVANSLVDKAKSAESTGLSGKACFDRNRGIFNVITTDDTSYTTGDWDLLKAAEFSREKGFYTVEDPNDNEFGTSPAPARCDNAVLYSGWYSLNNYNDAFSWATGAIGYHLDSSSAAHPRTGTNWSKNALEHGITITSGAVDEPFVGTFPHPDQVFRNLFQGANVGDAFLRSMVFKEWQFINMGDPLYRPFPNSSFPVSANSLPGPWQSQDIGSVAATGTANYYNGNFSIQSSGIGFYGNQDAFRYTYQGLSGNGEITAQISRLEFTHYNSTAYLMIRENLSPGSRYAAIGIHMDSGYRLAARTDPSGFGGGIGTAVDPHFPFWVKLIRKGNLFSGYYSTDRINWQFLNSVTVNIAANAYIGLAVTEGNNSTRLNKTFFSDVRVSKGSPLFDYDGDGKADVSVFRAPTNTWYLQQSSAGFAAYYWATAGDQITPADYDGDGKSDFAVYRPSNSSWYIVNSSNSTITIASFGLNGDIPVPADYDGDGKADIAIYRPSNATWWRINSSNGTPIGDSFGAAGDKPTTGDFDGDGKADLVVYRPSIGTWYLLQSTKGFLGVNFGLSGDLLVPADYDGDGKTDIAIYRPSDSTWWRFFSSTGQILGGALGNPSDIPAPADYDGDGKADIAAYRPSTGNWIILGSAAGLYNQSFGNNQDKPTPSAYVR